MEILDQVSNEGISFFLLYTNSPLVPYSYGPLAKHKVSSKEASVQ
jgi:hypothetical protein